MEFRLAVERRAGLAVIRVFGELDIYSAQFLDACVNRIFEEGHTALAIDLTDCSFLDSEGIKVLIKAYRFAGHSLTLVGASRHVLKTLTVSGLNMVFHIVPSLDDLSSH